MKTLLMMLLSTSLGIAGLVDVSFRFYDANESAISPASSAGVIDAGNGWYQVTTEPPAAAASVRWQSAGTPKANAREYFTPAALNPDQVAALAAIPGHGTQLTAIGNALTAIGTTIGAQGLQLDALGTTIDGQGLQLDAIAAKTSLIQSGQVTVAFPVSETGEKLQLIAGDDYKAADGRALEFSSESWPDLTGAAVLFKLGPLSVAAEVTGPRAVRAELAREQTAMLRGSYLHELEATLASGNAVTVLRGNATVLAQL